MEDFLKMPPPLIILGVFFSIVVILQIIQAIKARYMNGVITQFIFLLKLYKVYFIIGIILILVMILVLDKPIANLSVKFYNMHFYTAIDFISSCGEGWFVFGLAGLFLTIFKLLNKHNSAILANICLISAIYAGLLNGVLKFILSRQRPSIGLNPYKFFHFFLNSGGNFNDLIYAYNSMPSGHTITVVAVITPLVMHAKSRTTKLLIMLIGLLEMFSRVYTMNHWLSDVSLATLLGIFIGFACYKVNQVRFSPAN